MHAQSRVQPSGENYLYWRTGCGNLFFIAELNTIGAIAQESLTHYDKIHNNDGIGIFIVIQIWIFANYDQFNVTIILNWPRFHLRVPDIQMNCSHDDVIKWIRVTGPLWGGSTGHGRIPSQRSVTRSFDIVFDLRLNKRLNKQSKRWWVAPSSGSLWRHCNVKIYHRVSG